MLTCYPGKRRDDGTLPSDDEDGEGYDTRSEAGSRSRASSISSSSSGSRSPSPAGSGGLYALLNFFLFVLFLLLHWVNMYFKIIHSLKW